LPTDVADVQVMDGLEAVEHLFRVTCGLDSRVVGEPQVLGQVRRAYALARDMGSTGPALANVFGRAIRLGRSVRNGTELGRIGQSLGSIAAGHVRQRLGDLAGRTGAVVGAGEAAGDAAESLAKLGARLSVVAAARHPPGGLRRPWTSPPTLSRTSPPCWTRVSSPSWPSREGWSCDPATSPCAA